jgi:glycosyltransferase involved in cell wall biosynthesis
MKPRILVISPYNPFAPHPGGSPRWLLNRLESLSRIAEVTIATHADPHQSRELIERLHLTTVFAPKPTPPSIARLAHVRGCAILLGHLTVFAHVRRMVGTLAPVVRSLSSQGQFDLIQVEDMIIAPIACHLPPRVSRLLVVHNILTAYFTSVADSRTAFHRKWLAVIEREWVRRFERQNLRRFPAAVVLTQKEREQARMLAPGSRIYEIPLEVDTSRFHPHPVHQEWPTLVFCGTMSYPPNEEAALHLYTGILPRIRQKFPEVTCYIVGRNPTAPVRACASRGFIVTGEVEDVASYLLRASVVVVPLLTGAGMRVKLLEAWALSRPVVSTPLGADGLEYRDGQHLLIADDAAQFADRVCSLLENPSRAAAIGQNGRRLVEERYSKERVWTLWERVYAELLGGEDLARDRRSPVPSGKSYGAV